MDLFLLLLLLLFLYLAVPVQLFHEATKKRIEKKINLFYLREVVVEEKQVEDEDEDEDRGQSAMVWGVGE